VQGIGSPAYMSPQQVKEQALDHQTDIYSLGVVMYQLLTGQLPFQARNNYDMIYQIINASRRRPSQLRKDIPPALDAIVARAMSKRLEHRYAPGQDFAQDLAQAFRGGNRSAARDCRSREVRHPAWLPFFADFSDVEIWEVVRFSQWSRASPGTVIIATATSAISSASSPKAS
jgi:serine/threonine protein kinase